MAGGHGSEGDDYHPQDAVKKGVTAALTYGGVGLFAASIQSALQRQPVGSMAAFTRFGGNIGTFALVGGVFEFSKTASANLRQKQDHYNTAIGGFLGGSILGMRSMRMPMILGYGAGVSLIVATFDYTGSSLSGWGRDPKEDGYDRKEAVRKNRRRPVEETIAEIGEISGIKPPGYEERRRQRLKEKYGVEINPVCADPNQATSS
ncbi:hypothetical protein MAPG_04093 [Magnaporthiopsis poae ATCC 64411]|uniref:NADH-ubiquinone oxidoreductase 21.3 kDa subunit n=1 Tax=Magnaporthiopsis poae (strain ATCC 64411 / 73-15) TaxID=644358 RepID=A0A0C4DVT2_MAGP6|nr:hypothetical protein MAPG_04093 [Magnaporthiopsis poae ATCC 64411]